MAQDQQLSADPNTADIEALDRLPGIGSEMARRIVEARPFAGEEDMRRVSGIGPSVLDRMRPYLVWPGGAGAPAGEMEGIAMPEKTELAPIAGAETPISAPTEDDEPVQVEAVIEAKVEPDLIEPEPPEEQEATAEPGESEPPEEQEATAEPGEPEPEPPAELEAEPEPGEPELPEAPLPVAEPIPEMELLVAEEEEALDQEMEKAPGKEEERPPEEEEELAPLVAEPAERPAPRPVTRAFVWRVAAVGGLLALLLAVAISLGILATANQGQLQYVRPAELSQLAVQVDGLTSRASTLETDVAGLRTRLDSLEALSGRVQTLEGTTQKTQADLEATQAELDDLTKQVKDLETQAGSLQKDVGTLSGRADKLEARADALESQEGRFKEFLSGLRDLLDGVLKQEEAAQ
jgi:prefoldin subunit 5